MERNAPYLVIAAFVLVGVVVAAGLLIWLSGYDPWRRTASYAVVFSDVSGLGLASEVRYNGLPVGEVSEMALDPAGTGLIRVVIEVLEDVPLRQGSVARLSVQGVTGVAVVALEGGNPQAAPLPPGPEGVPMLAAGRGTVETLAAEAPGLLEDTRALVGDLRVFVTPENAERIARILADLERGAAGLGEIGALADAAQAGLAELRDAARAVRALADGAVPTLGRLDEASQTADATLADAAAILRAVRDAAPALLDEARNGVAAASAAIDRADGTLGQFAGTASSLDRALRKVAAAADEIRRLAERLLRDPSSVIWGR